MSVLLRFNNFYIQFFRMLHGWLGDPVVPGWITPTLPFTLAYLNGFEKGPDRIQAMIALQLLVAFVFIFMGITKLADKFVNGVPNSIKGGILIAAPITVLQGQLSDGSQLMTAPVATLAGTLLLAFLSFSPFFEKNRSKYKILDIMAKYGNLFPYLIASALLRFLYQRLRCNKISKRQYITDQSQRYGTGSNACRYIITCIFKLFTVL